MAEKKEPGPAPAPELERLRAEVERLREENRQLAERGAAAPANRPEPQDPTFGLSEGERQDLLMRRDRRAAGERIEVSVTSPFTGRQKTEADLPAPAADAVRRR